MTDALQIDIRPAVGHDVPWVYKSWLQNYRDYGSCNGKHGEHIPKCGKYIAFDTYFRYYRALVERITSQSGVLTLVAVPSDNPDHILGWLCGEVRADKTILHYAHVKAEHRRRGIMRALIGALGVTPTTEVHYTHHTKHTFRDELGANKSLPARKLMPPHWRFNPYLFLFRGD